MIDNKISNEKLIKTTQEQAVASWIDFKNALRTNDLIERLSRQDLHFEEAMAELQLLKDFAANPSHILGSILQKHGELSEHAHVNFSNADNLIQGLPREYTFEGVGRTAMEDYLCNGQMVQAKCYSGISGTLTAIANHLEKYPDFIKNGGTYDVARNRYADLMNVYQRGSVDLAKLSSSDQRLFQAIKEWEQANDVNFSKIVHPMAVDYDDVQLDTIHNTIRTKEREISNKDRELRAHAKEATKPTVAEGLKATTAAAVVEGGMAFALGIYEKLHEGKKLTEFTEDDWRELGIDAAKGTVKGGVRGISIYALTNKTSAPAPMISSMVTASFGMAAYANKLARGEISELEFIESSEVICLDSAVSALSSIVGTVAIPIPVLGTVIGNAAGMFMYEIAKNYLSTKEEKIIQSYQNEVKDFCNSLEQKYQEVVISINREIETFNSITELAFSDEASIAFLGSLRLAEYVGVPEEERLSNDKVGDDFFLN